MKIFRAIAGMFKRILFLFFNETGYIKAALTHEPHGSEAEEKNRAQKLKRKIIRAFYLTSIVFLLSLATWAASEYLHWHISHACLYGVRWFAYAVILLGVLSPAGWEIRTYSGETLSEIVDEEWHRLCYAIAAYLLATSYLLE